MFDTIRADIGRFHRQDERNTLRLLWYSPGLKSLIAYRFGVWLRKIRRNPLCWPVVLVLAPFYWMLSAYVRLAFDIILDTSAVIGPGLYIGHFGGIRLRDCRLGSCCSIQQEVYLEPQAGGSDGPIIGNNVWIGAHARIQGPIKIGNGVTVGGGAFVTRDVAERCLVLGNPARVMQREYDNSSFL
jgi:serine O-acetyltransferase